MTPEERKARLREIAQIPCAGCRELAADALRPAAPAPRRIRVVHPGSASILAGEVVEASGKAPSRSFRLIPDALLEEVVIREGVWLVSDEE